MEPIENLVKGISKEVFRRLAGKAKGEGMKYAPVEEEQAARYLVTCDCGRAQPMLLGAPVLMFEMRGLEEDSATTLSLDRARRFTEAELREAGVPIAVQDFPGEMWREYGRFAVDETLLYTLGLQTMRVVMER